MKYYVGLDVSNKETAICIVDQDNNIVKEAKVLSDPDSIHRYLEKTKLQFESIGIESGGLSHWLVTGLKALKWNAICIDSRKMAALISINVNKTDRKDAREIANAMRTNNFTRVHIKSTDSIKINCLLTARKLLVKQRMQLAGTIRGLLKTFGIKLGKNVQSVQKAIDAAVANKSDDTEEKLSSAIDWSVFGALIVCHEKIDEQLNVLDKKLETLAKADKIAKRFMTHPGVGPVTALTYKAEIDDPKRFKKSRSVGAYLGMTPKQYSSGETTKLGRVSKHGSKECRSLLHEAGVVLITRTKKKSKLKTWGLKKKKKLKTQKAGMAVGRKIAINLHQMWIKDMDFDPQMCTEGFLSEDAPPQGREEKKQRTRKAKVKVA